MPKPGDPLARVLIYAPAVRSHGGVSRHIYGLPAAAHRYSPTCKYVLFVNDGCPLPVSDFDNVEVRRHPIKSTWTRWYWDQLGLPRLAAKERVDVIWAFQGFGAVRPQCPQVVFERRPTFYCDRYLATLSPSRRLRLLLRRWIRVLTMRAADRVVTPTVAMKSMITSAASAIDADRVTPIRHPFSFAAMEGERLSPRVEEALAIHADQFRFVYVGHVKPYKELNVLVDAMRRVRGSARVPSVCLMTISPHDWESGYEALRAEIESQGLGDSLVPIGKVDPRAITALYKSCDAVVYPSTCESYGWPLAEATSLGLPVVAVDVPINREMAGGGAVYYRVGDGIDAAQKLITVAEDSALRAKLSTAGRLHFEETHETWQRYLHRCLALSGVAVTDVAD